MPDTHTNTQASTTGGTNVTQCSFRDNIETTADDIHKITWAAIEEDCLGTTANRSPGFLAP